MRFARSVATINKINAEAFHAQLTLAAALPDPAVVEADKARLAAFNASIREQAIGGEWRWWGSGASPSPREVKASERCRREAAEAKRAARGFGLSREELHALVWSSSPLPKMILRIVRTANYQ